MDVALARDPDDHCSRRHPTQIPEEINVPRYFVRLNRRRNRPVHRAWRSSEGKKATFTRTFLGLNTNRHRGLLKKNKKNKKKGKKRKKGKKMKKIIKNNNQWSTNCGRTLDHTESSAPDPTPNFQFPMVAGLLTLYLRTPDKIPFPAIRRPHRQPPDASRRPQELM